MSAMSDRVFKEALALSESERSRLANVLLESLEPHDPEADRLWAEAIQRRVKELESGGISTIPWSDVKAELEAKLARFG